MALALGGITERVSFKVGAVMSLFEREFTNMFLLASKIYFDSKP